MTTGAVFCSVPNREQWSIELSQARKAHLLTDILKGERISSETEILASFSPLAPPFSSAACAVASFLAASSARRMVCHKGHLAREIAGREGFEAADIREETHHPLPSMPSCQPPRQGERKQSPARQGIPALTDMYYSLLVNLPNDP